MNLLHPKFDPDMDTLSSCDINLLHPKFITANYRNPLETNLLHPKFDGFQLFFRQRNKFLTAVFILAFAFSMTLSSLSALAGSESMKLNLSHITCGQDDIEVHFVVVHLESVSNYGQVIYVMNNQNRIAPFLKRTGGTAHYSEFISPVSGTYDVTSGHVVIDGVTVILHNPHSEIASCEFTPSPTPTSVPTPTPSPDPSPTPTSTPTPGPSPSLTPTPTPTPSPTSTPSPSPTLNPTPSPSPTPTPISTPIPSPTPSPNPTPSPSPTPTPTPTPSNNGGGGGGGGPIGDFINGPLANQSMVAGTTIITPTSAPKVLGESTLKILPETGGLSLIDRMLFSIFIALFFTGIATIITYPKNPYKNN